jgi:hypothetical protein
VLGETLQESHAPFSPQCLHHFVKNNEDYQSAANFRRGRSVNVSPSGQKYQKGHLGATDPATTKILFCQLLYNISTLLNRLQHLPPDQKLLGVRDQTPHSLKIFSLACCMTMRLPIVQYSAGNDIFKQSQMVPIPNILLIPFHSRRDPLEKFQGAALEFDHHYQIPLKEL